MQVEGKRVSVCAVVHDDAGRLTLLSKVMAFSNITTHVITGFLGTGKTTALISLLHQKPKHERWAILVNEFGQMGLDVDFIPDIENTQIKQVPGGCLCCAAKLPFQVALNQLIKEARPDRIFIEPTGLGHPENILGILTGEHFRSVLDVRATLTLIDPRHLSSAKHVQHALYQQQLNVGDIWVANKTDLCEPENEKQFDQIFARHVKLSRPNALKIWTQHGDIPLSKLNAARDTPVNQDQRFQDQRSIERSPEDASFTSSFWSRSVACPLDAHRLALALEALNLARVKGLIYDGEQWCELNGQENSIHIQPSSISHNHSDSKLEIIHDGSIDRDLIERLLNECQSHR